MRANLNLGGLHGGADATALYAFHASSRPQDRSIVGLTRQRPLLAQSRRLMPNGDFAAKPTIGASGAVRINAIALQKPFERCGAFSARPSAIRPNLFHQWPGVLVGVRKMVISWQIVALPQPLFIGNQRRKHVGIFDGISFVGANKIQSNQ